MQQPSQHPPDTYTLPQEQLQVFDDSHETATKVLHEVLGAYDEKQPVLADDELRTGSSSQVGAAATAGGIEFTSASELASSNEIIELSLNQLGNNIRAMRSDAKNKAINPSPDFIRKRQKSGTADDYGLAA